MPVRTFPLGLVDTTRKVEEADIREGDLWAASERKRRADEIAASRRGYEEIWSRLDAAGPLPGMPRIPQVEMGGGSPLPAIAPSENDPNREMTPLGPSPRLTQRDIEGDPIPARFQQQGVGGPEQEQPPEDELAAIEAELARRELAEIEAELQRRGEAEPKDTRSIDDAINESVKQIPGGYENWLNKTQPPREGFRYERDPLSKSGRYAEVPVDDAARQKATMDRQFGMDTSNTSGNRANLDIPLVGNVPLGYEEDPANLQIADILDKGADFLLAPITGRQTDPENDPVKAASSALVEPTVRLPASAVRDPYGTALAISPPHMAARSYGAATTGLGQLMKGDFGGAAQSGYNATMEAGGAALGAIGLRSLVKPNTGLGGVPEKPAVREPSVKQAGKTLVATAVPGRKLRPQATKALVNILENSNIPRDRIVSGLTKVENALQRSVDGSALSTSRAPTVAQLLEREFGDEFPEVRQQIRTTLLERRLTKKRGDASPTIVREGVQEMRGSQVPYLTEAAEQKLGSGKRGEKRDSAKAEMRRLSNEGYKPLLSQPIDDTRGLAIIDALTGPGSSKLMSPLREVAEQRYKKDWETFVLDNPLEAAHWAQRAARLEAEKFRGQGDKVKAGAFDTARTELLSLLDDLETPDGKTYADLRKEFGDEASVLDSFDAGKNFGAISRDPQSSADFTDAFNAATPGEQDMILASVGDWVVGRLRGGGEDAAARMTEIQSAGVLDTLEGLGAKGKDMADAIRSVRDEELFLKDFYPKSESATITNREALAEGPDIYSKGGGRSGRMSAAAADAAMMSVGATQMPLMTLLREGPKAYSRRGRPLVSTREDMTKVLMSRPGRGKALREAQDAPDTPSGPSVGERRRAAREAGDLQAYLAASGESGPDATRWAVQDFVRDRRAGQLLDALPPEKAKAIREAVAAKDLDKAHDLINAQWPNIGRDVSGEFMNAIDKAPLPKGVQLSDKQATIWQMMEEGASHRDMAKKLGLEYDTLEEIEAANKYLDVVTRSVTKRLNDAGQAFSDPKTAQLRSILGPNADKVLPKKGPQLASNNAAPEAPPSDYIGLGEMASRMRKMGASDQVIAKRLGLDESMDGPLSPDQIKSEVDAAIAAWKKNEGAPPKGESPSQGGADKPKPKERK